MKCIGELGAKTVVYIFFADGFIAIAGPDLLCWMHYTRKTVPSEQNLIEFIWPNIQAAWRAEFRTWSFREAKAAAWSALNGQASELKGQPTPGVYVWRSQVADEEPIGYSAGLVDNLQYAMKLFLNSRIEPQRAFEPPDGCVVGLLLDQDGVELRFFTTKPMIKEFQEACVPRTVVTILGGPKGVPLGTK